MKPDESEQHWKGAFQAFVNDAPQTLWRSHSDQVNSALLNDWLDGRKFSSILKTDLCDEAVCQGLYPLLARHADVIHGVDIALASLDGAKSRYPGLQIHCADVRSLPFGANCFAMIVSNSTLDHFHSTAEIAAGLGELFRVLQSGGELIITLDNLQNPIIWLRSKISKHLLRRLHLIPYFVGETLTRSGLVSALQKAGFEVLETRPIMHCPRVLAVAVSNILQKWASTRVQQRFLGLLNCFEWLAHLPMRYFTGHFVAARALKP